MIDPLLCSQIIALCALIGFESQECTLYIKLQEWHSLNMFTDFAYRVIHAEQSLLLTRFRGTSVYFPHLMSQSGDWPKPQVLLENLSMFFLCIKEK